MSVKMADLCARMEGQKASNITKEIELCEATTQRYRLWLQDPSMRMRVKKAKQTKAKDEWYTQFCETCGDEFTDCGEQGYDSNDSDRAL